LFPNHEAWTEVAARMEMRSTDGLMAKVVNGVRGREEETDKGPRRAQDAFQLKLRVPDVIYVMLPPLSFRPTTMSTMAAYNLPVEDGSVYISLRILNLYHVSAYIH
jgi:hypothetical protein